MNSVLHCKFCNKEKPAYTCPRCNYPYCSIQCYQHKDHLRCSESFYQDWVTTYMKSNFSSDEGKKKILESLKRLHEEDIDDNDEEEEPLEERIKNINLDSSELWDVLTETEKAEFQKILENGDICNVIPKWEPWWNFKNARKLITEVEKSDENKIKFISRLSSVKKLSDITKVPPSVHLINNLSNVLCSYSYMARLYNGDYNESYKRVAEDLFSLSSVLEKNSVFSSLGEAIHSLSSIIVEKNFNLPKHKPESSFVLLLQDLKHIVEGPNSDESLNYSFQVLFNIEDIFCYAKKELKSDGKKTIEIRKKISKELKKIEYYQSWLLEHGFLLLQISSEIERLLAEKIEDKASLAAAEILIAEEKKENSTKRPLIEELS